MFDFAIESFVKYETLSFKVNRFGCKYDGIFFPESVLKIRFRIMMKNRKIYFYFSSAFIITNLVIKMSHKNFVRMTFKRRALEIVHPSKLDREKYTQNANIAPIVKRPMILYATLM